jgi:hypothetical protein
MGLVDLVSDLSQKPTNLSKISGRYDVDQKVSPMEDTFGERNKAVDFFPNIHRPGFDKNPIKFESTYTGEGTFDIPIEFSGFRWRPPTNLGILRAPITFSVSNTVTNRETFGISRITREFKFRNTEKMGLDEYYKNLDKESVLGIRRRGAVNDFGKEPFIVRQIGSRWGIDIEDIKNPNVEVFGNKIEIPLRQGVQFFDNLVGDVFGRGAPGFSGFVGREFADATRKGRFVTTGRGVSFLAKQIILQKQNPRLETTKWNPLSLLSSPGVLHLQRHLNVPNTSDTKSDWQNLLAVGGSFVSTFLPKGINEATGLISNYSNVKDFAYVPGPIGETEDGSRLTRFTKQLILIDDPMLQKTNMWVDKQFKKVSKVLGPFSFLMPDPPVINSFGSFTPLVDLFYEFTGTGVRKANRREGGTHPRAANIDKYSVLAYGNLQGEGSYTNQDYRSPSEIDSTGLEVHVITRDNAGRGEVNTVRSVFRNKGKKKINAADGQSDPRAIAELDDELESVVKKGTQDDANVHAYGGKFGDLEKNDFKDDFIPFRFRDAINGKWIIFRAILGTITDTLSPEWNSERYIGRPDQVHVYMGTNRQVTFDFKVYPKTKYELITLWDKLNFLVGLTYPSYSGNRMVPPFTYLTIGKIFDKVPGFLSGLTVNVPEETTWEIDQTELKLPKFVTVNCDYTYINKYLPSTTGKHYDLPWLKNYGKYGTFDGPPTTKTVPDRKGFGANAFWPGRYDFDIDELFSNPLGAIKEYLGDEAQKLAKKWGSDLKKQIFRQG